MKVEVWNCEDGSTTAVCEDDPNKSKIIGQNAVYIRTIEGNDWEDCMIQHHKLMGWEAYTPFSKTMQIIVIGDLHGYNTWKKIVEDNPNADKYVFLGDYFDSKVIPYEEQIKNFDEIISFKEENPDKTELLIGNHDYHYLTDIPQRSRGYQAINSFDINRKVEDALKKGYFKICYKYNTCLFSHAGFTKTWCENNNIDISDIENSANDLLKYKPKSFLFLKYDGYDKYGDNIYQSPLYIRPKSLMSDALDNYIHIVGHTRVDKIELNLRTNFVDALAVGEYLEVSDYNMKIKKIQ